MIGDKGLTAYGRRDARSWQRKDHRREVHEELHQQRQPLADVGVEHPHRGQQQTDRGADQDEREQPDGEQQQAPAQADAHERQHGQQEHDLDARIEEGLIDAGNDQ